MFQTTQQLKINTYMRDGGSRPISARKKKEEGVGEGGGRNSINKSRLSTGGSTLQCSGNPGGNKQHSMLATVIMKNNPTGYNTARQPSTTKGSSAAFKKKSSWQGKL